MMILSFWPTNWRYAIRTLSAYRGLQRKISTVSSERTPWNFYLIARNGSLKGVKLPGTPKLPSPQTSPHTSNPHRWLVLLHNLQEQLFDLRTKEWAGNKGRHNRHDSPAFKEIMQLTSAANQILLDTRYVLKRNETVKKLLISPDHRLLAYLIVHSAAEQGTLCVRYLSGEREVRAKPSYIP